MFGCVILLRRVCSLDVGSSPTEVLKLSLVFVFSNQKMIMWKGIRRRTGLGFRSLHYASHEGFQNSHTIADLIFTPNDEVVHVVFRSVHSLALQVVQKWVPRVFQPCALLIDKWELELLVILSKWINVFTHICTQFSSNANHKMFGVRYSDGVVSVQIITTHYD